jgi:hypothetical protein
LGGVTVLVSPFYLNGGLVGNKFGYNTPIGIEAVKQFKRVVISVGADIYKLKNSEGIGYAKLGLSASISYVFSGNRYKL